MDLRHDLAPCDVLDISHFEEVLHVLLLKLVVFSFQSLEEPVRVLDARHRVQTVLQSSRNRHYLHDGASEPFFVVVPIEELSEIALL